MKRICFFVSYITISLLLFVSCSKKEEDPADNPTSVPDAPENLKVSNIDASSVKLEWTDASNNEKGFRITRFSFLTGFATDISVAANTSTYIDGGLTPYTYKYKIFAFNSLGNSEPSNEVEINVGPPIAAPTNLQATAVDSKTISLTWTKNSTDFSNFTIERSTTSDESDFTELTAVGSPSYSDNSCSPSTTYYYRVYQNSSYFVKSDYSNTASAKTLEQIQPPTNITCSWTGSGFLIEWTASTSPNVTYTIIRKETGQSTGTVIASDINTTSHTDATAVSGRYYYYSVKAVSGGSNSSEYSDEYKCFTTFNYNEVERNGPTSSLTTLDWSAYMDENTADKELLIINGGYSGTYAGYNAASYKYYDWDLFELTFDNKDIVKIEVLKGNTSGLWGMDLRLTMIVAPSGGSESALGGGNPTITGSTFTWNITYSSAYNMKRAYLMVSMPDDLINYGPYDYQLRITITRQQ